MNMLRAMLAVGSLSVGLASAQEFSEARLGVPRGYASELPESDDTGSVFAFTRTLYGDGTICGEAVSSDVYVADLRACSSDVLRRITKNGISLDASISADGSLVAWRTYDAGASSDANHIFIGAADGSSASDLLAFDGTVSNLELSPSGEFIACLVEDRTTTSGIELLLVEVADPSYDVADASTVADGMTLNRDACMLDDTVVYTKYDSLTSTHDIYLVQAGEAPALFVPTASAYEERLASITHAADPILAFRRTISGVDNVIETYGTPPTNHSVTSNTSSSVHVHAVSALQHPDLSQAFTFFVSNGDFASENGDGSLEVFRHEVGGATVQLTSYDYDPPSVSHRAISGIAAGGDGTVLAYSTAPADSGVFACDADNLNGQEIRLASAPGDVDLASFSGRVLAPFELATTTGTGVGCAADGYDEVCTVRVANSTEEARTFIVKGVFEMTNGTPSEQRHDPGPFVIDAGDRALITFRYVNEATSTPHGTLHVQVVSPDVAMPDTASGEVTF